jgi:hypothetical protein
MKTLTLVASLLLSVSVALASEIVTTELGRCFVLKGEAPASPIAIPTKVCFDRIHVALDEKGPVFNHLMAVGTMTVKGEILDLGVHSNRAYQEYEYEGTDVIAYSSAFMTRRLCKAELNCATNAVYDLTLRLSFEPADAFGRPKKDTWKVHGVLTTLGRDGRYDRFLYEAEQR